MQRKTIGLRVPDHPVALALLAALGEPLLSTTLILPGDDAPLEDAGEIRTRLERDVELVLDGGPCGTAPTTVVDLTGAVPEVLRAGKGAIAAIDACFRKSRRFIRPPGDREGLYRQPGFGTRGSLRLG